MEKFYLLISRNIWFLLSFPAFMGICAVYAVSDSYLIFLRKPEKDDFLRCIIAVSFVAVFFQPACLADSVT